MVALVIVSTFVVLVLGILVAGLLRSHADILRSLHELGAGVGDPAASTACCCRARCRPSPWSPAGVEPGARGGARRRRRDADGGRPGRRRGQQRRPHAARVPLLGLHRLRRLLGRPAGPGTSAAARPHPRGDRHQGPRPRGPRRGSGQGDRARVPVVMSTEAWLDYQVPGLALLRPGRRRHRPQGRAGRGQPRRAAGRAGPAGRARPGARRRHRARPRRGLARTDRPARRPPTRCCRQPGSSRRPEPLPAHPRRRLPRTATERRCPARSSGHHRRPRHHGPAPRRLRGPHLRAPRQPSA